ncbi:L-selectin-like isoform X2 [Triplophysa dalaica]|uniref:L-selectin-like isoform X2 n=1 Tax=Triplophysa dalaica TaxID=1582913 RepID=UPI0024DFBA42|nr:L-selectin-like isoform X2 [Triplophysa dalaica]
MFGFALMLRAAFIDIGLLMYLRVILVDVEGWTYGYSNTTMNWTYSRKWCKQNYTDIVMIHNENVTRFLEKLLPRRSSPYYWIGLKKNNGNWTWVSHRKIAEYQPWAANEPNNIKSNENCVEMYITESNNNGKWNDEGCEKNKLPVCHKAQCSNNPCTDRGDCIEQVNNFTCVCKAGLSGPWCETAVSCEKLSKPSHGWMECSGAWNAPPPTCAVECYPVLLFGGGLMNCTEGHDTYKSTCRVQCPPGHLLLGFVEFTCRSYGTWTSSFPLMCASYVHCLIAILGCFILSMFCCCSFCCFNCRKSGKTVTSRTHQETVNPAYEEHTAPEAPLCSV